MLNPFDPEITGPLELDDLGEEIYPDAIDAEAVRQSLGDFQKIQDRPTLYGAR